jgi:itaconate CoA-transferase
MHPLAGITVVSIEQAVAAPFATRQLADLGARVIKIERPDAGDFARGYDTAVNGLSSYYVWLNRSKESLALDLKAPEAATVLAPLIAHADVFVQNLAPGAAARLGADTATLRARHPRLVVCSISGYGAAGPYAGKRAYDLLVQAETGLLSITGTEESPSRVGISVADIAAGMYAFSGILAALFARERTGEGAALEVSLFDALAEWMSQPAYYAAGSGRAPARSGAHHPTVGPYGPFTTRDAQQIYLAVQTPREWSRFCTDILQRPDAASDDRWNTNTKRVANRPALHALVDAAVSRLSADELTGRLDAAQIAHARMNDVGAFFAHPQLDAADRWRTVHTEAGPTRALRPPIALDGDESVMGAVPRLGEHTDAILSSLDVPAATIADWRARGLIR